MSSQDRTILLNSQNYVHVLDNNSGVIILIEGPYKGSLDAHKSIYGKIKTKIMLEANQYCIILNPFKDGKILEGVREVRKGPMIFSLHPGEIIEKGIKSAFSLAENQGIYIKNLHSGNVRMELGPKEVILNAEEELYEKILSDKELKALKLDEDYFEEYYAPRIELDESQIIQLIDDEKIRYEIGPKTVFLNPFEHPRVVTLSGDTPKRPDVINTAIIRLGPDFLSDILVLRTKDNAELKIHVRYKWRINIEPENLGKVFLIEDFIGYASETIASIIRGAVAKHNFEDFHSKAADIIKEIIFSDDNLRIFGNGFEIFSVDIKKITPVDPEIAEKLNAAVSSNMDVFVKKTRQQAELDGQRHLIEGEKIIEQQRKELIALENINYEKESIEKAKIEADTEIEKARGIAEAEIMKNDKLIEADVARVSDLIKSLTENSDNYLKLIELEAFNNADSTLIVPEDTKLWLPIENKISSSKIIDLEED